MADTSVSKLFHKQLLTQRQPVAPRPKWVLRSLTRFERSWKTSGVIKSTTNQKASLTSAPEGKQLAVELKRRLEQVRQRDLSEIFKADLQESKKKVDAIRKELAAQPPSQAFEPVKARLLQIENQFLESGRLLRGLGKLDSPQDYLKMQVEMYRLTQNVELLARVAGEAASGVNKVLSTQV